jgi:drug/metabolite transporter (DMT)-like permease
VCKLEKYCFHHYILPMWYHHIYLCIIIITSGFPSRSQILFTGFCTVLIMRKPLTRGQWLGIFIVMVALGMVGASSALRSANEPASSDPNVVSGAQVFLGIVLILVGSLLNSIQNVVEETLLKGQRYQEVDPLEVVGWEGFFGCVYTMGILMPIAQYVSGSDCGVQEDTVDTFVQLGNSPLLIGLCLGYAVSLALMNNYSQIISKNLSAIVRMLVSTLRVVVVWITGTCHVLTFHFLSAPLCLTFLFFSNLIFDCILLQLQV